MNSFQILIHFLHDKANISAVRVQVDRGLSFNEFRRRCSVAAGLDVLSIFSRSRRRLTDISEVEAEHEVFVYDSFYPRQFHNSSTTSSITQIESEEFLKGTSEITEKPRICLQVETFGPRKAGKTSLIFQFVKNNLLVGDNSSIMEAVFEKEIDVRDHSVHFSISDVKESDDSLLFDDRVRGKEVLIFCIAKTDILQYKEWLSWSIRRAHGLNPKAVISLVITKSDMVSSEKQTVNPDLFGEIDVLVISTSIYDNYMPSDVKSSEEVFAEIAQEVIDRSRGTARRAKLSSKGSAHSENVNRQNSVFWLLRPLKNLTSCFTHR
jgi:GTPase SAR1 family protein